MFYQTRGSGCKPEPAKKEHIEPQNKEFRMSNVEGNTYFIVRHSLFDIRYSLCWVGFRFAQPNLRAPLTHACFHPYTRYNGKAKASPYVSPRSQAGAWERAEKSRQDACATPAASLRWHHYHRSIYDSRNAA